MIHLKRFALGLCVVAAQLLIASTLVALYNYIGPEGCWLLALGSFCLLSVYGIGARAEEALSGRSQVGEERDRDAQEAAE